MRRADIGWALILSIPLGLGVSVGLLKVTAGRITSLVIGGGALTVIAVFLLVVGGAIDWSDEEPK